MKLKFFNRFSTRLQVSSFIKIRSVGAELFHADRQTDTTKLTVTFVILQQRLKRLSQIRVLRHETHSFVLRRSELRGNTKRDKRYKKYGLGF